MELLFWSAVAFIVYVYAGYPALLAVWATIVTRRTERVRGCHEHERDRRRVLRHADDATPGITVIIAARDEAPRLAARIHNLLKADYPADRLQIVVASDGSTDDTAEVLKPFGSRVELLQLPPQGKAAALNAAVERARYPILVFADARQRFARNALRTLATRFTNWRVGAVSGELLIDGNGSTIGDGVGAYWQYEKRLRRYEATVGSTIGVTGALYAMRRELWQPLPGDTLLDDVLAPMRVVLAGHRVVFEENARAFDDASKDAGAELRRKVRTLAGNFQLLALEPKLVVPLVNPVWFQFMSHKIARLLVPYALVATFGASAALADRSLFYAAALAAQCAFYGLAIYGALLDRRRSVPAIAPGEVYREAA
jgi:poly-beta-1,6-N-acetyl-D-glucosamine synthase